MTTPDRPLSVMDGLSALAQIYFDAAYEMDADKFASIIHERASVTRIGDQGEVVSTPVATWLEVVRTLTPPRATSAVRRDQIHSIHMVRDMALMKLSLRIPPREVTDLLSCFLVNGRWQIVQKVFSADVVP